MNDLPSGGPILIPCEGSGAPLHLNGMCMCCGEMFPATYDQAPEHDRDDIVARIERGDFG